jgi:hypothetical protein
VSSKPQQNVILAASFLVALITSVIDTFCGRHLWKEVLTQFCWYITSQLHWEFNLATVQRRPLIEPQRSIGMAYGPSAENNGKLDYII